MNNQQWPSIHSTGETESSQPYPQYVNPWDLLDNQGPGDVGFLEGTSPYLLFHDAILSEPFNYTSTQRHTEAGGPNAPPWTHLSAAGNSRQAVVYGPDGPYPEPYQPADTTTISDYHSLTAPPGALTHAATLTTFSEVRSGDDSKSTISCDICETTFMADASLRRHKNEVHSKPGTPKYVCKCGQSTIRKGNHRRHLAGIKCKSNDDPNSSFTCTCHWFSSDVVSYLEHIQRCRKKPGPASRRHMT